MTGKPSLRRRLSQHVLVPLVVTWALGTITVVAIAGHFAAQAFDRSLLDDAYALASHVSAKGAAVSLTITRDEMATLLFDQSETMYFAVLRPDGSLVAGHPALRTAATPAPGDHEFTDEVFEGRQVRMVTLRTDAPDSFVVVMGQTTRSRTKLLERLLAYSALPQALLLVVLAWWLRRRMQDDLQPLAQLHGAIESRHAADLTPLSDEIKAGASTRDVERIAVAIDSMLLRLQEGLQAQREFAGTVAHELRTPLAGIRAQAAFALSQQDSAVWRQQLEGIAQAEQRASRLVDQLLALARAGEGQTGVGSEPIALDALAREALLRFMPRARGAGVDLGGEGLDESVTVHSDRALLEGILNNLVDNALRYGTGCSDPRITVAIARGGAGVELSVTDNGEGVPSGDIELLTRRWVQGDKGKHVGQGAGLGLAIVSRYAELLGARFTMANVQGGGARAALLLPD
ncbi:MAG TPA: sensor histidine kinase [Ramlibacter sp.]|nr:sensor histidine kinase [Ramlibacter sp.]